MGTKKCIHCGTEIDEAATRCYKCKEWQTDSTDAQQNSLFEQDAPQDFLPTALFAWFLGAFGVHRFYIGNIPIGVAQLLTLGGCGIWTYIDFILICFNKFKDGQGRHLAKYSPNIGITLFVLSLIPLVLILFVIIMAFIAAALAVKS